MEETVGVAVLFRMHNNAARAKADIYGTTHLSSGSRAKRHR
jgi:hypothetical protein